jgi:hypothetical protein
LRWWFSGGVLSAQLRDEGSETRSEAELAVERVVMQTHIAPDCVVATVMRGGPCIILTHDGAKEAFIHKSYTQAADKAIEWLEKNTVRTKKASRLSHHKRQAFNRKRLKRRRMQ